MYYLIGFAFLRIPYILIAVYQRWNILIQIKVLKGEVDVSYQNFSDNV